MDDLPNDLPNDFLRNLPADFLSANKSLNACGLECPQPVLECRQQLGKMNPGQTLYIIADDPNTQLDFEVYTMRSGNQLVATHAGTDGCFHYLIRKQARQPA